MSGTASRGVMTPGAGRPGAPPPREGQTFAGESRLVLWANFVKLPHTAFALPFAIVGVVMASYAAPVTPRVVLLVVLAFTAARFAAMAFNRLADHEIDARNPRTRAREIPAGRISARAAAIAVVLASLVFIGAAWALNPLCALLSPVALAWVLFYSYTKRFTRWSHLVLGLGLGIAPVGGYLAVTGVWPTPWWSVVALAAAVMTWVAGFDVLYALQDAEFDRSEGLHSLPATLGAVGAVNVARALHVACIGLLVVAGAGLKSTIAGTGLTLAVTGVGANAAPSDAGALLPTPGWMVATAVAAVLLAWEHRLVKVDDHSRLDAAFFTMNGVISILFCTVVLVERVWR